MAYRREIMSPKIRHTWAWRQFLGKGGSKFCSFRYGRDWELKNFHKLNRNLLGGRPEECI